MNKKQFNEQNRSNDKKNITNSSISMNINIVQMKNLKSEKIVQMNINSST